MDLAAAYRASEEAADIGGDFYEVHPDAAGWSVAIGDVCGKGIKAAVLTGQVRQSLRTVALVDPDPARRLQLLNSAMLSVDSRSFVTAVHGVLARSGDGLTALLAGGGHPAPLVRRSDGRVHPVPVKGPIIGILEEVSFQTVSLHLDPGDTLVLYTDGLPDARGATGLLGDESIAAVIGDCVGMTAQATAERLMKTALEFLKGRPHDDMAVLVIQPRL